MKQLKNKIILLLLLTTLFFVSPAGAEIIIDKTKLIEIEKSLKNPAKIYTLDLKKGKAFFDRIDAWISNQAAWSKAKHNQTKKDLVRWLETSTNRPVRAKGYTLRPGLKIRRPFVMVSQQGPQRRYFIKDISEPAPQALNKNEAETIARTFIKENQFCPESGTDKLGTVKFMQVRRRKITETAEDRELIISQIVLFKRMVEGFEVFNSKQIVIIHPATWEILSYQLHSWTPIKEGSVRAPATINYEELLKKIRKKFSNSGYDYQVTAVNSGMYQAESILFPAIRLTCKPVVQQGQSQPFKRFLIFCLAKDLKIDLSEPAPFSRPEKPGSGN